MQARWITVMAMGGTLYGAAVLGWAGEGVSPIAPPAGNPVVTAAPTPAPAATESAAKQEKMQQAIEEKLANPPPWVLEKYDANHDGKLDDAERAQARDGLQALWREHAQGGLGPGGEMSDEARTKYIMEKLNHPPPELLKRFDLDGDGKLSQAEKDAALAEIKQHQAKEAAGNAGPGKEQTPEQARAALSAKLDHPTPEILQHFDKDGDGKLSPTEKQAAIDEIVRMHQAKGAADPSLGVPPRPLTPEEVKARFMARLENPDGELLKRFDQDGDGKLSPAEKEAAIQQMKDYQQQRAAGTAN